MDAVVAVLAERLGFPTLETRGSDRLDFREVAGGVKAALEAGQAAGRAGE